MSHAGRTGFVIVVSLAALLACSSACRRQTEARRPDTIPPPATIDAAGGPATVPPSPPSPDDVAQPSPADSGGASPAPGIPEDAAPRDADDIEASAANDALPDVANVEPRALPAGFTAVEGTGVHPSGWPLAIRCRRDDSVMVLVPEGEFTSGLSADLLRRLAALADPPELYDDEALASPEKIALIAEHVRAGSGLRMLAEEDLRDVERLGIEQRAALVVLLFLDATDALLAADDLAQWKRGDRSLASLTSLPSYPTTSALPEDVMSDLLLSGAERAERRIAAKVAELAPRMQPETRVRLGAFYIDRYEVTNAQYRRFVDARHDTAHRPGLRYNTDGYNILPQGEERLYDPWADPEFNRENQPVTCVSEEDAEAYARWARKSIPTRLQWERTAVGDGGRLFPWGSDLEPGVCGCLIYQRQVAQPTGSPWLDLARGVVGLVQAFDEPDAPATVGSYPRDVSPFGCFDLGGNVSEWVRFPGAGEGGGDYVVMGGNFKSSPSSLVPALTQTYVQPGKLVGFRTILELDR
jgi:formylglycine-generating enzyme required for sulfatase activity